MHGAWHGSWCWHKVVSGIKQLGHRVIATDLPGHYKHKRSFEGLTLASYVKHVEELVQSSDLPVVLVGHSMAGVVVTQVAENRPDKIDRLVYVSAFVPENGGSLMIEKQQAIAPSTLEVAIDNSSHAIVLEQSCIRDVFYANCGDEDTNYALSLLQAQPLQPFVDAINISNARFGSVAKLYIECLQDKAILIQDQRRMHSKIECDVESIDTDHSPFFSADHRLVELICGK